jgi:hypothetical protein
MDGTSLALELRSGLLEDLHGDIVAARKTAAGRNLDAHGSSPSGRGGATTPTRIVSAAADSSRTLAQASEKTAPKTERSTCPRAKLLVVLRLEEF